MGDMPDDGYKTFVCVEKLTPQKRKKSPKRNLHIWRNHSRCETLICVSVVCRVRCIRTYQHHTISSAVFPFGAGYAYPA